VHWPGRLAAGGMRSQVLDLDRQVVRLAHRSMRVPLREGRSKTMAPGGSAHAACKPRARQKWTACSEAGSPDEPTCARNCSANALRPDISESLVSIATPLAD